MSASLHSVSVSVNGTRHTHDVEPRLLLVNYLRETLGLTGTHVGCDTSQCGACTVLVDDNAIKACTMFAVQADGARIMTIEGLATDDGLHPMQEAFWDKHGLQCGFCTPGMIISAVQLLRETPRPTHAQIRHGIVGNLCRCTGYQNIILAIESAAEQMQPVAVGR